MSLNIAETFELLFDKNNTTAYKALQNLQKESQETACVYPYMDKNPVYRTEQKHYQRARCRTDE